MGMIRPNPSVSNSFSNAGQKVSRQDQSTTQAPVRVERAAISEIYYVFWKECYHIFHIPEEIEVEPSMIFTLMLQIYFAEKEGKVINDVSNGFVHWLKTLHVYYNPVINNDRQEREKRRRKIRQELKKNHDAFRKEFDS